jgi:hypothetical protein
VTRRDFIATGRTPFVTPTFAVFQRLEEPEGRHIECTGRVPRVEVCFGVAAVEVEWAACGIGIVTGWVEAWC